MVVHKRLTDCRRTSSQDDVGVECIGRSGLYATLARVRPEEGGLTPSRSRYGLVRQTSLSDQIIKAKK
jgi:hypothetical protein